MLTVTKTAPNRVDVTLDGSVDAETMRTALDELIAQSEGVENGRMLYRIPDFAMPSFDAIWVEFSRLPKLFGLLGRYDRCAVLTDIAWIRTAAKVEGALIPGLAVACFDLDDADAAEAWLAED